jgi:hypothetical protein
VRAPVVRGESIPFPGESILANLCFMAEDVLGTLSYMRLRAQTWSNKGGDLIY